MTPVNLTLEKWLRLIRLAHVAIETGQVEVLGKYATQMREAASPVEGSGRAACQAFRWACLWFAHADAGERVGIGPVLLSLAEKLEGVITPTSPDPVAVSAAAMVPPPAVSSWALRRDING